MSPNVAQGFTFQIPEAGLAIAVAVFGITGVGATELYMYTYWCVEKGYARYTGPREDSEAWRRRARGWVRVMNFDVIGSMIIYTIATVAFYLLGAGILNKMGLVPDGKDMIADVVQHLHPDLRRMGEMAVLPGRDRHPVRHHHRRHRRPFAHVRRLHAAAGHIQKGRLQGAQPLARHLHRGAAA